MSHAPQANAFRVRLSQRALDSSRPALAHQSLGRPLTAEEAALAEALAAVYATGTHDFAAVAEALARDGVIAPCAGGTAWSEALLAEELAAINADLDAAYQADGYGA